jgi:uncharacterized protein YndB with AHSA1/START domain
MPDILHRVGIDSPIQKVFKAITSLDGLSHWWITGTTGDPRRGGTIHFRADGGGFDMKVVELKKNRLVRWKCVGGPKEWIGTELTFRPRFTAGQTILLFTHARWNRPVECMHHCSTKWATFLLRAYPRTRWNRCAGADRRRFPSSALRDPGILLSATPQAGARRAVRRGPVLAPAGGNPAALRHGPWKGSRIGP